MKDMGYNKEKYGVPDDETATITNLARAIKDYNDYKTSVGRMLYECRYRKCYKPEDRIYGTLGVLGYINFPIAYEVDMKDLMRRFIEHAYYNRDVSWIAIHVDNGTGFIPSHENLKYIGELWREITPGMCNINFKENTLCINACVAANITHYHESDEIDDDTVEEWEINWLDVIRAKVGHCKLSDDEIKLCQEAHENKYSRSFKILKYTTKCMFNKNLLEIVSKRNRNTNSCWDIVSKVLCAKTEKASLVTIYGKCNVGDKIMILPMYDKYERTLGLIVNEKLERTGICLYPKMDIDYEYSPHEFAL